MPMSPQDVIRNLGDLPTLPSVAAQAVRLSADTDTSVEDLTRLVRSDQALTGQVLKVANSAMFGMVREVTTLTQAIMTLGFAAVRSIVIASSVKNLFARGQANPHERPLWEHALVTGLTGSAFGRALRYPRTEEVFLAGLLHDVGKSVLSLKFPDTYLPLLKRVHDLEGETLALELETYGFDHAMVGEALVRSWNLSEGLEAAVRWHHEPSQADRAEQRLVALVALGNQMALDLQIGLGMPDALAGPTWESLDILGLNDAAYQDHRARALEALERDKALINEF